MRITNLNPADEIGASAWLVQLDHHALLLDAGVHPRWVGRRALPLWSRLEAIDLDAIALSHCHLDHVGALPLALRYSPHAPVFMTEPSYFLAERILHNSVNVMVRQREELGARDLPLYRHDEVEEIAPVFQGLRYQREIEWALPPRGRRPHSLPTLELFDAGHVMGSAGVLVRGRRRSLFYTGDVSFRDQTLQRGAQFEGVRAEVVILETTRGEQSRAAHSSRSAELNRLLDCILATQRRKGCVLIPAFALGRTQEILGQLALWMKQGHLRRQPVYIGGLARVFTEIYELEAHRIHRQHSHLRLDEALDLKVPDRKDCASMSLSGSRLFVLTAGMLTDGTASHELALRLFPDSRHAICFVGYADPDTPGGRLKASAPGQPFLFSAGSAEVTRACEVHAFDLTAHAERDELVAFVGRARPETVILGHGSPAARGWFAAELARRFPRLRVVDPQPGDCVEV